MKQNENSCSKKYIEKIEYTVLDLHPFRKKVTGVSGKSYS